MVVYILAGKVGIVYSVSGGFTSVQAAKESPVRTGLSERGRYGLLEVGGW